MVDDIKRFNDKFVVFVLLTAMMVVFIPSTSSKYVKEYSLAYNLSTELAKHCNIWWTTLTGATVPGSGNISVGEGTVKMNGNAVEISSASDSKLQDGYYLIVVKGGNGGRDTATSRKYNGHSGGIVAGIIQFKPKSGEKIFAFLGTNGTDLKDGTAGGTNGLGLGCGGSGGTGGAGGGAATVVFLSNTGSYAENNMIIVAAGGGGARNNSNSGGSFGTYKFVAGLGGKIIEKPQAGNLPYANGGNTYGATGGTAATVPEGSSYAGTNYAYPNGGTGGVGANNSGGGGGGYAGGGGGVRSTQGGSGGSSFAKNDLVRMTTFSTYKEKLGELFDKHGITGISVVEISGGTGYNDGLLGDGTYFWDRSFVSLSYLGTTAP